VKLMWMLDKRSAIEPHKPGSDGITYIGKPTAHPIMGCQNQSATTTTSLDAYSPAGVNILWLSTE